MSLTKESKSWHLKFINFSLRISTDFSTSSIIIFPKTSDIVL
nr:MAG TPA: hypothetical protein [Caudoviricetes sp.]